MERHQCKCVSRENRIISVVVETIMHYSYIIITNQISDKLNKMSIQFSLHHQINTEQKEHITIYSKAK